MVFHVTIKEEAKFFIERLDKSTRVAVDKAILSLRENPITKGKAIGTSNGTYTRAYYKPNSTYKIYYLNPNYNRESFPYFTE